MADVNSFPISVDVTDIDAENRAGIIGGLFGIGKKKDVPKVADDVWAKHATIFKLGSKLGSKKTIAFSHEKDIHVALDYDEESELLPTSTDISIEQYNVSGIAEFAAEMVKKELGIPKVSLQFELDSSGLTRLLKAEAVVEETVMVDEEIEVPDDEADNATVDDAKADGKDDVTDDAKVEDDAKLDDTNKTEGGVKNETIDDLVNATDKEKTDAKNATAATKKKKKTKIITVQKVRL
jgi:hypoxia up-regulated 1